MERFVIEALKGISRHPVEGVRDGPFKVKGFSLRREGGYIPIGGLNDSWLGEQGSAGVGLEDGDTLLMENGDIAITEWSSSPDLSPGDLIAQDETSLAFLSDGRLWYGAGVATVPFPNTTELALAPRAGLLAPWRVRNVPIGSNVYEGGAVYEEKSGVLSSGLGPGVVTVVENAGTAFSAGLYEFLWTVEAPTTNGLVVHHIGYSVESVAADADSLDLSLDTVFPEGTLLRFYYRGMDQNGNPRDPEGVEFFGAVVSDGANAPEITLSDPGTTFFPTDDVLMNFAPGRLEAHNGRIWGAAGDRPFQPILSQNLPYVKAASEYMLVSGGPLDGTWQSAPLAADNHILEADGDYIQIVAPRLTVRRLRTDIPTIVPIASNEAGTGESMSVYLQWDVDAIYPRLIADGHIARFADIEIPHSGLVLETMEGSQCNARNLDVTLTQTYFLYEIGAGLVTVEHRADVVAGDVARLVSVTKRSDPFDSGGWFAWSNVSAVTTLYLGRLAPSVSTVASFGNREWRVSYIETGTSVAVVSKGDIADYDSNAAETTWTSSSPNAETWAVSDRTFMVQELVPDQVELDPNPTNERATTLVYSSVGSVNRGKAENFLPLSPLASKQITALASTPAGLLVFMDSETFLARGDPATEDLNVQRLTGTLGCDPNVIPARLGSVVMPIYQGEIYAVSLGGGDVDFGGGLVNISKPVWDPDDPFVQVVGEPIRNHLVARTNSGRVYRLDTESQEWINDVFDEQVGLRWILSAGAGARYGVRYNVDGYLSVLDGERITTPEVSWDALDLGDKNLMKLWRRMEVYTEGVGDGAPTLTYTIRGGSGTVAGLEQGGGRWIFTLPRGIVGAKADLLLEFPGATHDLVVEPPIAIEYQPRYRER